MQNKRQIINIVNFIRDIEPRDLGYTKEILFDTVKKQIELADKHNLKTTFLLPYDALTDTKYQELLKALEPSHYEIGLWHEIVQPQCEKLGIKWTGRYPWDWHCHCGFSVGYAKEDKYRLLDLSFETFKEIFGYYPRVFGSWLFDSPSLRYITEKYGLDACCNCKEQYGTDGYTEAITDRRTILPQTIYLCLRRQKQISLMFRFFVCSARTKCTSTISECRLKRAHPNVKRQSHSSLSMLSAEAVKNGLTGI